MIGGRGGHHRKGGKRSGRFQLKATEAIVVKVRYILSADPHFDKKGPRKRVALVAADNVLACMPGDDPALYAETFVEQLLDWTLRMRGERKLPKDVCIDRHVSFHPDDPVDAKQALEIARNLVERVMGPLNDRLAVFAVHADRAHVHVHFLASVVDTSGKIFNPHHDDELWMQSMDELELEHGLHRVAQRPRFSQRVDSASTHIAVPGKAKLQRLLRETRVGVGTNFPAFLSALDRRNIQVVSRFQEGEYGLEINGCSFYHDGEMFQGGQVSKSFAWSRLSSSVGYSVNYLSEMRARTEAFHQQSKQICILSRDDAAANLSRPSRKRRPLIASPTSSKQIDNDKVRECFFHWGRNAREAFCEIAQGGGVGMEGGGSVQLHTTAGMSRSVVRLMLERALALGWKGLIAAGSKEFVRLVNSVQESWVASVAVKIKVQHLSPKVASIGAGEVDGSVVAALPPRAEFERSVNKDALPIVDIDPIRPFTRMVAGVDEVFRRFDIADVMAISRLESDSLSTSTLDEVALTPQKSGRKKLSNSDISTSGMG